MASMCPPFQFSRGVHLGFGRSPIEAKQLKTEALPSVRCEVKVRVFKPGPKHQGK